MNKLEKNIRRGCDFLLCKRFPIICGAMTWVSDAKLVSAICNAGCFGVLASGSMEAQNLEDEIIKTKTITNESFGVNLITMHPQLLQMIDVCLDNNIQYIVFAGSTGAIKKDTFDRIKSCGAKIICFAPSLIIAKGLIKWGVDALILEGSEAGGHIGPVSTTVLAQEILPFISEVPVFIGGGIGSGNMIKSFINMGASGVQLGTKFVCSYESSAHPKFKEAFISASSRDAVASIQLDKDFKVIPVRALKNKASEDFIEFQKLVINEYKNGIMTKESAQLKIEKYWAGSLKRAVIDGDVECGSLMAGQSVGMVYKEQSVNDIIEELLSPFSS